MNKKQLIREVAGRTGFSIRLSKIIVNCCIKTILSAKNIVKFVPYLKSATIIQYTIKGRFMSR